MSERAYVVILHGILFGSLHMSRLARFLGAQGYEVINIDYPSRHYSIEELITWIANKLKSSNIDDSRTIHFVGYSMGGLLLRGLLHRYRPRRLGRVVQIGPPNHGSEVADFLKKYLNTLYKAVCGPAGQELVTNNPALAISLGQVDYPVGVIAGNASISPVSSYIIPGEDDGKVSVESTKLEGMSDHIVLPVCHIFLPLNAAVQERVLTFLQTGRF